MKKLIENIEKHLQLINVELYHLEWDKEFGTKVLRIVVDQEMGINMDRIIVISKHISSYLDENEPTKDNYNLEVLSAGIERELHTKKHWDKSLNKIVFVVLKRPNDNVKRIFAKVINVDGNKIVLETNDESKKTYTLGLKDIKSANWAYKEKENAR